MKLHRAFEIEVAASSPGWLLRPGALRHVNIARYPGADGPVVDGEPALAAAADGYLLAVVPCSLDAGDVPGLLAASALRALRRQTPAGSPLCIALREATAAAYDPVTRAVWSEVARFDGDTAGGGQFPDLWRIIDPLIDGKSRVPKDLEQYKAYLDPTLARRCQRAMGASSVEFRIKGARPVRITPVYKQGRGAFRPGAHDPARWPLPLAAAMPMLGGLR